jgi:hypothetical protein
MQDGHSSHLDRIDTFGGVAAEADTLLGDYFVQTAAYKAIARQERFIVVGRKGTGKTAIYKRIEALSGDSHAVGLQFENYPWGAHNEVANTQAAPVEKFTESWRFLTLVEVSKLVLATRRVPLRGRALKRFLKRNWGSKQFGVHKVFEPSTYDVEIAPSFLGSSVGAVRRRSRVDRPELAGFLSSRNDWLKERIARLARKDHRYFVLFDGLDIAYTAIDEEYKQRIIGLLLAAREIASWSRRVGLHISPVVFLRSDIYSELTFADQNKMTEDNVQLLMWNDAPTGESSLKTLIDERIRAQVGAPSGDPWSLAFDPATMRGTQQKYKYMVERTYLRPRDMIKFANVCLDIAKNAGHGRIVNDDVYAAKDEYSDYVVSELNDEISAIDPEWSAGLEVLRDIHRMTFERPRFEDAYRKRSSDLGGKTPDELLRLFYRFGIIGFVKKGGGGRGGSELTWQYKDPKERYDPGANNFRVHWSLKEYLDLVE